MEIKPRITRKELKELGFEEEHRRSNRFHFNRKLYGWYSEDYGSFSPENTSIYIRRVSDLKWLTEIVEPPVNKPYSEIKEAAKHFNDL